MKKVFILILLAVSAFVQADLLDDITSGAYKSRALEESTSMSDGESYAMLQDGCIYSYSYKTGKVQDTLFDINYTKLMKLDEVEGFILSPNPRYLLVYNHSKRIFRHSFSADYYIYDRNRRELKVLSDTMPLRDPVFSPDGKYIAFARENNLFIHKMDYHTEVAVTRDGKADEIFNGVTDWLYEEEFGTTAIYCFSPDSKQLAFVRLDERDVPVFSWQEYLDENGKPLRYPCQKSLRYPKSGDNNAKASVCVYDTYYKSIKTIQMSEQADSYFPRLKWTNATSANPQGDLVVLRLNRDQNKEEVFLANPKSTLSSLFYKEESKKYFVDYSLFDEWQFLSDNSCIVVSEQDGYRHAYLYSASGIQQKQLTKGEYDVTCVYGYDEATQTLFYQAADKNPMTRYVYSLNVKKNVVKPLSSAEGIHNATFSIGYKYFVDAFQSVTTPACYTLYSADGKALRELKNNNIIADKAKAAGLPTKEFFSFSTPNGDQLNGWMLRPADFDATKKYPVLMMHYSGPASQQVLNRWRIDWEEYLVAKEGFICVCIDPRGTDARGRAFRNETYMSLGTKEAEDQVYAARYLQSLSYVDAEKVGIWGWSYGGYATIAAMSACGINPALGESPFAFGMAVAPVIDWRLYDSAYTERYMRRPQVNEFGYDRADLAQHAAALQGNLLIIHGLADDNVHAQSTMIYANALVEQGKQFEMQIYPDDNHFLRKRKNYNHVYRRMLRFLKQNVDLQ